MESTTRMDAELISRSKEIHARLLQLGDSLDYDSKKNRIKEIETLMGKADFGMIMKLLNALFPN